MRIPGRDPESSFPKPDINKESQAWCVPYSPQFLLLITTILTLKWDLKCFQKAFISFLILSSPSPLSPFSKCKPTQFLWNPGTVRCYMWDTIHNLEQIRGKHGCRLSFVKESTVRLQQWAAPGSNANPVAKRMKSSVQGKISLQQTMWCQLFITEQKMITVPCFISKCASQTLVQVN